jgi:hypothetical protein
MPPYRPLPIPRAPFLPLLFPAGGIAPAGLMTPWLDSVVAALGAAYGRKYLSIEWSYCVTSDACYDQLQTGQVDMLWGNWVTPSARTNPATSRLLSFEASPWWVPRHCPRALPSGTALLVVDPPAPFALWLLVSLRVAVDDVLVWGRPRLRRGCCGPACGAGHSQRVHRACVPT